MLYDRLQLVHDSVRAIKAGFGLPTTPAVTLLHAGGNVELTPPPDVRTVDPRKVGSWLTDSVQLMGDEQELSGISRMYSRSLLEDSEYVIAGKTSRFVYLYDHDPLAWRVVVKPYETE